MLHGKLWARPGSRGCGDDCQSRMGTSWGLDRLLRRWRAAKASAGEAKAAEGQSPEVLAGGLSRREALEDLAATPLLGVLGSSAYKKYRWEKVQAITGTTSGLQDLRLKDLKGHLPQGDLGKLKVSRVIFGGNVLSGGAPHARDLIYAPSLWKAYNTDRKVFETLELAERAGVNSYLVGASWCMPLFNKYRELNSSKMISIVAVAPTAKDLKTDVDKAIDYGASTLYVRGVEGDIFIKNGQIDGLGKALDYIKSQGYLGGIGAHSIEVPIQCEKAGLQPDYYMKTLHHDKYWSAIPRENRAEFSVVMGASPDHNQYHDNMWDLFPEKTIEFMQGVKRPWLAFKVLAAGAIHPEDGFKFAFENGADFICVGMFDFQIVEDVNIALEVLANLKRGPRPWYA